MNKGRGNFWVWFLTIPLLAFSAYRNLDLILTTLGDDPGAVIAGVGALFALDIGVLLWLVAFNNARGDQRSVAGVLVVLDLIGAVAGLLADTLLHSGGNDALPFVRIVAGWAIPIIIGVNFGGGILYHMADPDRAIADAQRELSDTLEKKLAEHLKANAGSVAAGAVPEVAQHHTDELVAAFRTRTGKSGPGGNGQPAGGQREMDADGDGAFPKRSKTRSPKG